MKRFTIKLHAFLFLLSCAMLFSFSAGNAAVKSDDKGCLIAIPDNEADRIFGSYEIIVQGADGRWTRAGEISEGKHYVGKTLDLAKFIGKDAEARVRIVNTNGAAAHIDYVELGGKAPSSATMSGNSQREVLKKIGKADMDVIAAHEKILEVVFPAGRKNSKLYLSARVEALHIYNVDFKFPVENQLKDIGLQSKFFTYNLGEEQGSLSLSSLPAEIGGRVPMFRELSPAATGHPTGYTYGWVMNDDKFLYAVIDFTGDNTMDGEKDYAKLFVKTDGGVKEFKLTESGAKWGRAGFIYTEKVAYQHKYYEFKIPLEELGAKGKKSLDLAFAAYGTCAGSPAFSPGSPYSFGNVTVGNNSVATFTLGSSNNHNYQLTALSLATGSVYQLSTAHAGGCVINNLYGLPGNTCTFKITLTPTTAGVVTDTLNAVICGVGGPTGSINLTGTGVAAAPATVSGCTNPNATNYNASANQDDGSCIVPRSNITTPSGSTTTTLGGGSGGGSSTTGNLFTDSVTLKNNGNASMYIYDLANHVAKVNGGAAPGVLWQSLGITAPFYIVKDNCSGQILQPNDTCTIDVAFFPTTDGTFNQSFNITTNAPQTLTYNLSGTSTSTSGNNKPAAFTTAGSSVSGTGVALSWNSTTDADNDAISYHVQYCDHSSFENCAPQSADGATTASASKVILNASMAGAVMVFGFMALGGMRSRKMKLLLIVLALSYGAMTQSCGGGSTAAKETAKTSVMTKSFTGLTAGTTYYWKVFASDGRGGVAESDTQTFVTGH